MNATAIPRMSFKATQPDLENERIALAKQAAQTLGYKRLALAIAAPGALLYALRTLGIEPLQRQKVEAYKVRKAKIGIYSGTKWFAAIVASFLAVVSLFVAALQSEVIYRLGDKIYQLTDEKTGAISWHAQWAGWHYGLNTALGLAAAIAVVAVFCGCVNEMWGQGTRTERTWKLAPIAEFTGNIPEFALQRALAIAQAVPNANFYVEHLVEEKGTYTRPLPDPFLFVATETERYYIDVWDEKEYEATL